MRFAFERLKTVLEPSGATALAALLTGRAGPLPCRVGLILSGGNIDAGRFARLCGPGDDGPARLLTRMAAPSGQADDEGVGPGPAGTVRGGRRPDPVVQGDDRKGEGNARGQDAGQARRAA